MKVLRKSTPSELFKMYHSKSVVDFEHWMEPLFFWESKTKWIHDDGSLVMHITPISGGDTFCYSYQIMEDEIFWNHKNSMIKFYYNSEDMSKVYIFEMHTWKFIGVIQPTLVLTKANKDEILKIHRRAVRNINDYRKIKKKQDENIENGLPEDYETTTPNFDVKILRGMLKGLKKGKRKEKGEVDITGIKIQNN